MTSSNWDNGGAPPAKPGLPVWGKVALGCGIATLLGLGSCVVGGIVLSRKIKKDPEGFKNMALGYALDAIRPEWDDLSRLVEALRTDEGCRALYQAQPVLAQQWATPEAFLAAAQGWRTTLEPLPTLTVEVLEKQHVEIHRGFGNVRVTYRSPKGGKIELAWDRAAKAGDPRPRRLTAFNVQGNG